MTTAQIKKSLGKVVEVCWQDAHSVDPWTPIDSDELVFEGLPCRTYGVVIAANENGIMVSGSINGCTDVGASWWIPKGMIQLINILKERDHG